MNSNKRSLGTTLLVFVVCLVIVTGSTFSLFTSESKVDIAVTSGNVDVQAIVGDYTLTSMGKTMDNDTFENGGTVTFADKVFTVSNITPGDYLNIPVAITNKSDVKVQYCVVWEVEGPLDGILDATVDGTPIVNDTSSWMPIDFNETIDIVINVGMDIDETTGEGLSADDTVIKFVVKAVQANGAKNPIVATTPDEFVTAVESAQAGDIIDATGVTYSITSDAHLTIAAGVTIKGLDLTPNYRGGNYIVWGEGSDPVVFENCTFGNTTRTVLLCGTENGPKSVIYNNCTFTGQVITNFVDNADGVAVFNNCLFTKSSAGIYHFTEAMGGTHIFNQCTFDYTGVNQTSMGVISSGCLNVYSESDNSYSTYVETNGCTFINCGTRQYGSSSTLVRK